MWRQMATVIVSGAIALGNFFTPAVATDSKFGPSNPFYAPSTLPFLAPPFDKIKDEDYQPAIEAGMVEQISEIQAIADNPAAPTLENTLVAMERTGRLLDRAQAAFGAASEANTNPVLQKVRSEEAPRLAAHEDAIYLNSRLFARVAAVYKQRDSIKLDPESRRLLEVTYDYFVHSGANLSETDKAQLKKLNSEISTLSNDFSTKLLAATKDGAYATTDKSALAGLSDSQIAAAAQAAGSRKQSGYVLPLQNTTQQPELALLSVRATREAVFEKSWNRTERGDANDTRDVISRQRARPRPSRT
jgi:peptidyl-dipeptidase Dcp